MKKLKKIGICLLVFVLALAAAFDVSIFMSQTVLSKTHYTYHGKKVTSPIRIVQLSDLHDYQFGKSNIRLIRKVKEESPDVIFLTGDMINGDDEEIGGLITLIESLRELAPVYASLGNHERTYLQEHGERNGLISAMEAAGAVVLEQEYVDTEINGQEIRIGGLYGYVLPYDFEDGSEQRFMEKYEDTDRFKVLLSHVPEGLLLWGGMERWKVDLVFSGHVHGGQVRLPFIGGLYDPEEGFFPTYTKGMIPCGNGTVILSAGLGSSHGVPRINDLPEIVICEVKP